MVCPLTTRLPQLQVTCPGSCKDSAPIRGVVSLLLGLAWFFPLSCCSKMLKLLCVHLCWSWEAPSPGPGPRTHGVLITSSVPAPYFLRLLPWDPFLPLEPGFAIGWGMWGPWVHRCWALAPCGLAGGVGAAPRALCFPHWTPQVRLEQIRQAESLEQVRSIMDEAPLRDIRDVKDS